VKQFGSAVSGLGGNTEYLLYPLRRHVFRSVVTQAHTFTDLMMPGMDGMVLIRTLKEMNPALNIIASTGTGGLETSQDELRALGVHVLLQKPYDAKKLLNALASLSG